MRAVLFTELQNGWVWEALWRSPDPTIGSSQGHIEPMIHDHLQTPFEYLPQRRPHHLSRQPMPLLCHLTMRKCCLTFRVNLLCFIFFPLPLVPSLGSMEKSLAVFVALSHLVDGILLSLLLSRMNSLSWLFLVGEMLLPSLWPFAGLPPVCSCVSSTGQPRNGPSTTDVTSQGLN